MHRAQIILERWQIDALKSRADREGTSVSALVREAVADYLAAPAELPAVSLDDLKGIGSDPTASGREHDRLIYDLGWRWTTS